MSATVFARRQLGRRRPRVFGSSPRTALGAGSALLLATIAACRPVASLGGWDAPGTAGASSPIRDAGPRTPADSAAGDEAGLDAGGAVRAADATAPSGTPAADGGSDLCHRFDGVPSCHLAALDLPADLEGDAFGGTRYFAAGAQLPAGQYRIAYLDGCMRYGDVDGGSGWTVHASKGDFLTGAAAFWLLHADGSPLTLAPGTSGALVGAGAEPYGAFERYSECVSANCALPSQAFSFEGGALGLRMGVLSGFQPVPGEDAGGRSPTFRLFAPNGCP
jgi:hypothetical protein